MARIIVDASLVVALGIPLALGLNAISPKGLSISRDYFPDTASASRISASEANRSGAAVDSPPAISSPDSAMRERLAKKGLSLVSFEETLTLYRDPRFAQGLVVFVDARNDAHYQEGHIPGAYQFDHYHMDQYIAEVLPICQLAERVVVYCTGGSCEDSEFAAMNLIQLGIPGEQLAIYGGGINEWRDKGMEVERGPRLSGLISPAKR